MYEDVGGTLCRSRRQTVLEFYRYGRHNLSHVYGYHTLVNNQTGGATFDVCDGWNGNRCEGLTGAGTLGMDFTPINSVRADSLTRCGFGWFGTSRTTLPSCPLAGHDRLTDC